MAQQLTLIIRAENLAGQTLEKLKLQVQATATATNTASKANTKLTSTAKTATRGVMGMTSSFKQLTTAIAGASAIYATIRAVRASVKEYSNYNKELHNVWTLTDYTSSKMEDLGGRVRDLSMDFAVTSSDALKAMYQIYSATFYGEDAFDILEQSLKGAAAGLSDVFTVADMMTTVLNSYGLQASEAARVNDVLFTTIKYGKTTMHELGQQFGRLAAIAAPAGGQIEELAAAIATLTRAGLATDWATTALRQSFMQVIRPTADLEKVITKLGGSTGLQFIKEHGFSEGLQLITDKAKESGIPLEKLFTNVRAVTAVLPLATTLQGEYALDLARTGNAAGAAAEAFRKQTESMSFQVGVMTTGLKDLGAIAAEVFLHDIAIWLKDVVNPLIKTMAYYIRQNRDELAYFMKGFGKIAKAIILVGLLYKAFGLLTQPITWLIGAAFLLFAAWETNLYGIRGLLENVTEGIKSSLTMVLDVMGFDGLSEQVSGMDAKLVAALTVGGLSVLGKAIFGALSAKAVAGGAATSGIGLAIVASATMIWSIFNSISEIKELSGAEKGWSIVDLAMRVLSALAAGGLAIALGAGAVVTVLAAAAGFAFAVGVQALMRFAWTAENEVVAVDPATIRARAMAGINSVSNSTLNAGRIGFSTGFSSGGIVNGSGLGDIIPAMLEPGEFVIPKWMMDMPEMRSTILSVWSRGKRMATGGFASFDEGAGRPARGQSEVKEVLDMMIAPLSDSMKRVVQPISDFFVAHGQDSEGVKKLFTNFIELVYGTEQARVEFERIAREAQETADEMNTMNTSIKEVIDTFFSTVNDLLKDEFTRGIRDFLSTILGMNDEAEEAAASFNIPKLMKLTRAAWGVAVAGQPYSSNVNKEESAWDRISNGLLDAVSVALGDFAWSNFISFLSEEVWGGFIGGPTQSAWETGIGKFLGYATLMVATVKLFGDIIELIDPPSAFEASGLEEALQRTGLGMDQYGIVELIGYDADATERQKEIMANAINEWVDAGESMADIFAGIDLMIDTVAGYDVDIGRALSGPNRLLEEQGTAPGNPFLQGSPGFAGEDALYEMYGMTPPSQATTKAVTNNYNVTLPNVTNAQEFADEMENITKMKNLQESGNRYGSYSV